MNFTTAAAVGAGALVLSVLAGLIGGVALVDLLLRGLFWGVVGFGGFLGAEALLKSLVPELFEAPSAEGAPAAAEEPTVGRTVDITFDEAPARSSGVEVVDEAELPPPAFGNDEGPGAVSGAPAAAVPPGRPQAEGPAAEAPEGALPDMGSFLDAFRPGAPAEAVPEEGGTPMLAEYVPEPARSSGPGAVGPDGQPQDPVILAKAIQTVMKRDA